MLRGTCEAADKSGMRTTPYDPVIVAHRGLHGQGDLPENSLPAFRAARKAGLTWVECDVWPSADGEPVVIHDETLDRTTNAGGPVAARRWDDLQNVHLLDAFGGSHPENHVPRLSEVFAFDAGLALLVEVKPANARSFVRKVIQTMKAHPGPWMLQSFDIANLRHAAECDPKLPLAYLVEDPHTLDRGISAGFKRINLDHVLLDESTARLLRERGITYGAWTVNDPADLRRVMDLGAQWIISDDPLLAGQLLAGRRPSAKAG